MKKIIPLGDWVLVKILPPPEGIIKRPEDAVLEEREGLVCGIGKSVRWINEGERVLLPRWLGEPTPDSKYYLIKEEDIIGIIREENG